MQLHLYPLKCDTAVFDAEHSSIFVHIAGFDKLVNLLNVIAARRCLILYGLIIYFL